MFRLNRQSQISDIKIVLGKSKRILRKLDHATTLDQIRGFEGAAAAAYWTAFGLLISNAANPFRRTRPGTDPVNTSINFLTAILERVIKAALQSANLHIGFGLLHTAQDNGDAAIYDLMEPFRAPLTEGLVAFLFNARRLKVNMFEEDDGRVRIRPEGCRALIKGYEQAVAKQITVPGKRIKKAWRPVMKQQAHDLARAFKTGGLDTFQPYLMEAD